MPSRKGYSLITVGALSAGIAVAAGAFGAHGLKEAVTPERLAVFETAVRYHLVHSLALILIGLLREHAATGLTIAAGRLMLAGILLFSGSLYLLVLADLPWLGAVTPLGGVAFIAGWAALALHAWRLRNGPTGVT